MVCTAAIAAFSRASLWVSSSIKPIFLALLALIYTLRLQVRTHREQQNINKYYVYNDTLSQSKNSFDLGIFNKSFQRTKQFFDDTKNQKNFDPSQISTEDRKSVDDVLKDLIGSIQEPLNLASHASESILNNNDLGPLIQLNLLVKSSEILKSLLKPCQEILNYSKSSDRFTEFINKSQGDIKVFELPLELAKEVEAKISSFW